MPVLVVGVGTCFNQKCDHFWVAIMRARKYRRPKWSISMVVHRVGIGARGEKQLNRTDPPQLNGRVKRRIIHIITKVRISPSSKFRSDAREVALVGMMPK